MCEGETILSYKVSQCYIMYVLFAMYVVISLDKEDSLMEVCMIWDMHSHQTVNAINVDDIDAHFW